MGEAEWLSHVNAGVLMVKLAMALIGISSIHLLKTFINVSRMRQETVKWQVRSTLRSWSAHWSWRILIVSRRCNAPLTENVAFHPSVP